MISKNDNGSLKLTCMMCNDVIYYDVMCNDVRMIMAH